MLHPQTPSGMPFGKYVPFHDQIAVDLPDRTWPTKRITEAPRGGAPSTSATATRRSSTR